MTHGISSNRPIQTSHPPSSERNNTQKLASLSEQQEQQPKVPLTQQNENMRSAFSSDSSNNEKCLCDKICVLSEQELESKPGIFTYKQNNGEDSKIPEDKEGYHTPTGDGKTRVDIISCPEHSHIVGLRIPSAPQRKPDHGTVPLAVNFRP